MKKNIFRFSAVAIFISFFIFFFTGCQREIVGPGGSNNDPIEDDKAMVVAGVRGTVIDENNQPVEGATVTSGTTTTTTDRYGVFRFKNISLSRNNGYVRVSQPGYFTGTRSFVSIAGRIHNVRIRLVRRNTTGTFDAVAGGTITLSSGAKLVMQASSVTDASGNPYSGAVAVAMVWIDPTSTNLSDLVPGDLRGINTNGEERGLETYGMLGVEMTGPAGQILKIAPGKTAELTFPIPSALLGMAPVSIDLWHFDEASARWKQEGTAIKTGTDYIARVSHFSFWNCDAPFPLITLCMSLVNASNSQPLNNVLVRITRSNGSYGSGWTDSVGNLCGKVPKNEPLTLQVMGQCNNVVYSQNIGPFAADATLGTISVTVPPSNNLIITGTITNCGGANVTNGAAVIYTGGSFSYTVPVTNGTFSHTIVICNGGTVNFSVIGIDYTAMQQSIPVSGTGTTGTANVGTVQACGISSAQFVEFIIDGTPYIFAAPPDQIGSYDSVGTWGSYSNKTSVYASRGTGGNVAGTAGFNFLNSQVAGSLPLTGAFLFVSSTVQSQLIITTNPMVNITSFGPSGGFIEGNFNVQMMFATIPKNVTCNFRVRRF